MPTRRSGVAVAGAIMFLSTLVASGSAKPTRAPAVDCDSQGSFGTPYVRGTNCRLTEVDGVQRNVIVYVPKNLDFDVTQPMPVVFMFHGSSGTGLKFYNISGWKEKAELSGLIAIFPTGVKYYVEESGRFSTKWNTYGLDDEADLSRRPPSYPPEPVAYPPDDVGFVMAILSDLQDLANVDSSRVYESGFSNGSLFCQQLAIEVPDTFAGAGCFAGQAPRVEMPPSVHIPVAVGIGSMDPKMIAGANGADGTNMTELPMTYEGFQEHPSLVDRLNAQLDNFGLSHDPDSIVEAADRMKLTFWAPADAADTTTSCLYFSILNDVKHQYPNGKNNPERFIAAKWFWKFWNTPPTGC